MTLSNAVFFADSHHGNAFGVKGPAYGYLGHRGDDTNRWPVGTQIPSVIAGTVVYNDESSTLGHKVVVQRADGLRIGFSHMNAASPLPVGAHVAVGQAMGPLGNTGTLSSGAHVHVTASYDGPLDPGYANVIDPRPFIVASRTSTNPAGSGGTPITEDDMTDAQVATLSQLAATYKLVAAQIPGGLNGWFWVDPRDGSYLNCASQDYGTLVASWGLAIATPVRLVTTQNEWDFVTKQYIQALGDPAQTEIQNPILDGPTVATLAAQIAAAMPAPDFTPLAEAIAALDTQGDTYQAQLVELLHQQFTGTITITPKA